MKAFIASCAAALLFALPALAGPLELEDTETGADLSLRVKAGFMSEGARDLGVVDPSGVPDDETEEGFIDVNAMMRAQMGTDYATFLRIQAFAPTGDVVELEDGVPVEQSSFAALREFYLEYGGITTFPGEVLRLGMQRIREYDGLWWDRDIESLRWVFDTTLVQGHIGVAEQFSTYRTDDVELTGSQSDRAYAIAGFSEQWMPGHYWGMRGTLAVDHADLVPVGQTAAPEDKTKKRRLGWVGVRAENGFYDYRRITPLAYWAEIMLLAGSQDVARTDELTGQVSEHDQEDVAALAGDLGARVRIAESPLQFGATYAYAQGGRSPGNSETFVQTGLESNRSRYTGTRSLLNRFNEALQADFSNLRAVSLFASFNMDKYDASVARQVFRRDDAGSSFTADGIDFRPVNASSDIGTGWDAVLTRHFDQRDRRYAFDDDLRSNIRLRGSVFEPGDAYGSGVEDQFRFMIEGTLWL